MKTLAARGLFLLALGAARAFGQTPPTPAPLPQAPDLILEISKPTARKLAVAVPELLTSTGAALKSRVAEPFTATLRSDLEYSGVFAIADPVHYPPGSREAGTPQEADRWRAGGAEVLVDTRAQISGDRVSVEARIWELTSRKMILGRRYSGGASYVERIAHTLANDLVKHFTGKDGIFLSSIAFVADREGSKEIYAMDFDGRGLRRLTSHRSLSLNPDGNRSGRIVYTSYVRLFPQLWVMGVDGSNKKEISTGVELNASASLSPDGTQIAFAGSAKGNSDIYLVGVQGGPARRLTTTRALEAAPAWSPTGRQILYTSDQTGTPQIYVMDAEGTGARRVTFAGNWNDEAAWSPDGSKIAFACRNEGDFNICLMDFATGQTVQLTSEGSNDHPSWSPDGAKMVYASRRGGSTQIYTMDWTGQNKRLLTDGGNNSQPVWLP